MSWPSMTLVSSPVFVHPLLVFLLGYGAILATPGPNLLVIGSIAALRGVRGAVPLCLGVSLGAAVLSAMLLAVSGYSPAGPWYIFGRSSGVLLLLWVALKVAQQRAPEIEMELDRRPAAAEVAAGFCTAVTNPLTATFFAAQFFGPLSMSGVSRLLTPVFVLAAAMMFFLTMSYLLARPFIRKVVVAWHRPICVAAAALLVLTAASTLKGLMG